MSKADKLKEEIGWLKVVFAVLVAILLVTLLDSVRAADDKWPEHVRTHRAELARAAVVRWCDEHSGYFTLNKGHPFCLLGTDTRSWLFIGEWRMVEPTFWWNRRNSDTEDVRIAVLWLVEPSGYPPLRPDASGRETASVEELLNLECTFARVAVENPARVPVVLVGPAADQCNLGD